MRFRQFLDIVEIETKAISISTYITATLYVIWTGGAVEVLPAVLLAVAVLCVDMGTTAFNTFYDYMRGVDNSTHSRERGKVLVHEKVAPGHALIVSLALYVTAASAGIVVAAMSSWWLLLAGAIGMLVGFLYNGGPLPISRTPLGEPFAGGALGSLLFLVVVFVHTGELGVAPLIASLPGTLVIASVLTVNNTCDIDGDRAAGRRTLSIVLGRRAGEVLVYLQVFFAYGLMTLMSISGRTGGEWFPAALPIAGTVIAPAALIISMAIAAGMHRSGYSHDSKPRQMVAIIRIVLLFTFSYCAILVAGLFSR